MRWIRSPSSAPAQRSGSSQQMTHCWSGDAGKTAMNSDVGVELYSLIMAGFPGVPSRTVAEDKLLSVKAGNASRRNSQPAGTAVIGVHRSRGSTCHAKPGPIRSPSASSFRCGWTAESSRPLRIRCGHSNRAPYTVLALHWQRDAQVRSQVKTQRIQAHACSGFDPPADSFRGVLVAQLRPAAIRRYSRRQPVLCFREVAGRGRLSHRESAWPPFSDQVSSALSAAALDRLADEFEFSGEPSDRGLDLLAGSAADAGAAGGAVSAHGHRRMAKLAVADSACGRIPI